MANVSVKGVISKALGDKGFSLTETITLNDGRSFDKYWTVWTGLDFTVGSTVQVSGELGAKILKDFQTKEDKLTRNGDRIVELSINNVSALGTLEAASTTATPAMPF